jgi:hypothetical protein
MVVKLTSLKADLDREAKGDWIDYPDWPGVSFKVSSTLSEPFVTERDLLLKRMAARNKPVSANDPEMVRGIGTLYCQHILHDWTGFDITYSDDVALETLTDVTHRDMRNAVDWCARKLGEVNVEFVDGAVKNSEKPSAGG